MDSNTKRGPSIWIATQRGPSVNTSLSKGVVKSWAGGDGGLRLVIIFTETSLQNTPPPPLLYFWVPNWVAGAVKV